METTQPARTIDRTTALLVGLLALLSVPGALCLGACVLLAGDPGIPPYSMTCTFQPAQSPAAACVASVFARNAFKTDSTPPIPTFGKFAAVGDDYRGHVWEDNVSRLIYVSIDPVKFTAPLEAFLEKQGVLRPALRELTNDLRDSCAPDAPAITCQTCSLEAGCHEWN